MNRTISTREFIFKPADYFKVLLRQRVRKYGLVILTLSLASIIYVVISRNMFAAMAIVLVTIGFILFIYYKLKIHVYGPVSRKKLVVQKVEFMKDRLIQKSSKGEADIIYSDIKSIEIQKDYILIYLDDDQFLYVPNDGFHNEEDRIEALSRIEG